ncbi:MAG: hypothetical protein MT490_17750 [Sphingomonas sp.]|uniref:hypothetical protein n=1 Tax=Sphingomonas sp. TaxID=28214 RepID=UPI0022741B35|nr:hypothetical protein [Sphingomonas sp.]MCX8477637.1 hypothetical protein [Sphingomonas sp.]
MNVQAKRYSFESLMVPDAGESGERVIKKNASIAKWRLVPRYLVTLDAKVEFVKEGVTLPEGTELTVTDQGPRIGCTVAKVSRMAMLGARYVCFIDTDGDDKFDHWFKRGGDVVGPWGTERAKIPFGRMYKIPEAGFSFRPSELSDSSGFLEILLYDGRFRVCVNGDLLCFANDVKFDRKEIPFKLSMLGAEFEILEYSDGILRVKDVVAPKVQVF